jgi:hypothetical protein
VAAGVEEPHRLPRTRHSARVEASTILEFSEAGPLSSMPHDKTILLKTATEADITSFGSGSYA